MTSTCSDNLRAAGNDAPAVAVSQLRITVSGTNRAIVDDVTFELPRGEVLGLVGESGSGKTALALALLGYARPGTSLSGGSIAVAGTSVLSASASALSDVRGRLVSYVPQDPGTWLNPALRIGRQLSETLSRDASADRDGRLREMLREVKLPDDRGFLRRYPHQLSGGQQQRVALAMAFSRRPPLVVLDEPTTGLDVSTQAHVLETVRELCEVHHTAAVYVTHDIAAVLEIAQRIAVMYAGQLVEVAGADLLVDEAAHPYARMLLDAVPDPRYRKPLVGIPGHVASPGSLEGGCLFANRCPLVQDACREHPIAMEAIVEGHHVRCRRWQETAELRSLLRNAAVSGGSAAEGAQAEMLSVEHLVAWYGNTEVLHDVELVVPRGECLALVGESGSGKTTLARCIGGMHPGSRGSITLDEVPLATRAAARSAAQRQAIQYIFQNSAGAFNPRKTVAAALAQPLRHFGLDCTRERLIELLEQVALPSHYIDRLPGRLSGGEQQRLAIARALAVEPTLLICDEITSALDVSVQASILNLLARLQRERQLTMLFVTHNVAVVRAIADRIIVLNDGVIVERGQAATVLDTPEADYTRQLVEDTPVMELRGR
jgi:peptide/nickel transport system ATP-binding protein